MTLLLTASCKDTNNNATADAAVPPMRDASPMMVDMGGGTEPTAEDVPAGPEPGYLWFAEGPIGVFTKSSVATSTNHGPSFTVVPAVDFPNFHDLVFDKDGNMWAVSQMGTLIVRCPVDQLGPGKPPPIPDITLSSPALKGAQSLTFDKNGNLWVMNYSGAGISTATIVRFDNPNAMLGDVKPDAALTISPSATGQAAFNQGTGIAFDADGNLWLGAVSGVLRIDRPMGASGQLTAAPSVIIGSPYDAYVAVAFDAAGSLWVTGARSGYFVMRIANPNTLAGNVVPAPAARVHLMSAPGATPASFAGGMGFDSDGALWIAMSNQIIKIPNPGALTGDVTAAPSVTLGLKSLPDLASKLVFWPTPPGLPIYQ
jgi:streptogramin lyase